MLPLLFTADGVPLWAPGTGGAGLEQGSHQTERTQITAAHVTPVGRPDRQSGQLC